MKVVCPDCGRWLKGKDLPFNVWFCGGCKQMYYSVNGRMVKK